MSFEVEDLQAMGRAFAALGIQPPKGDSPDDMANLMIEFAKAKGVKTGSSNEASPEVKPSTSDLSPLSPGVTNQLSLPPKISFFSGEEGKDTPFDLWQYEVGCLIKSHTVPEAVLNHQVRKSLKAGPARVAMRLGEKASTQELLERLHNLYGSVESSEELLSEFYQANQRENENVVQWSGRLEDLLLQAKEKASLSSTTQEEMLRTKFWAGLRPALKEKSRHKFDAIKDFDELRIALRQIETEMGKNKTTKTNIQAQVAFTAKPITDDSDIKALRNQVANLQQQVSSLMKPAPEFVATLKSSLSPNSAPFYPPPNLFPGNVYNKQYNQPGTYGNLPTPVGNYVTPQDSNYANQPGPQFNTKSVPGNSQQRQQMPLKHVQCWRCGNFGHYQNQCTVITDHLNPRGPTSSGGQR